MTYAVTVDICIPEGTPEMDPLQRAGAVALIESGFDSVEGIDGPDGMEVDLLDTIVAVYPGGALLKVFVDAEALEFAEDAVREVVAELLERSELLADWKVERCEVELHPELAQESLAGADGPDVPPDDPSARKARHTEPSAVAEEGEYDARAKAEEVRAQMLVLADELRSFSPVMFGVPEGLEDEDGEDCGFAVSPEDAQLAAGALVYATDVLVDELFDDVHTLEEEETTVGECEGALWHLEDLPERYALQYGVRFARRFLVTVISMTTRFTNGSFDQLSCIAEELALRLLLRQASANLELFGLLDEGVSAALDAFADNVYEDMDHEWLYDGSMDGIDEDAVGSALGVAPMGFGAWFTPFNKGRYVHPSAADEPDAALGAPPT
ncbi:hypothetical protein [Streptomyces telluris]|uniref:Uncharacterized protein n=1 Tax=Streptomyces telluris TaxID=2720021 RepID=A0A9X2LMT6_9ACTN|nr:hypothetical protein [Streptomyces telluris]MCQ8774040.1 hypothetical protein [Streptomyces telluris]NJP80144.1 hypothetical protein [Streptomyces telluris]